jgi:hypothetical protein
MCRGEVWLIGRRFSGALGGPKKVCPATGETSDIAMQEITKALAVVLSIEL